MKHKHADVLIAIAEGKDVQYMATFSLDWIDIDEGSKINPIRYYEYKWRIKPEPKPDVVKYAKFFFDLKFGTSLFYFLNEDEYDANLKITIDAETGRPKSAEVISCLCKIGKTINQ